MEAKSRSDFESAAFVQEVVQQFGGETLTRCYQCGTCASSCPVAKITTRFNPRLVINHALVGNRTKVLTDRAIWLCCSCFNCQERCPQGVAIAELIYALRNMAVEAGYAPKMFSDMFSTLTSEGRIVPVTTFTHRRRNKLGLPPMGSAGIDPLMKILSTTPAKKPTSSNGARA